MSAVPAATRDVIYARAGFLCERCGGNGPHFSVHHRSARRMGGSKDPAKHAPSNLLLLCGTGTDGCHGHVEHNPSQATADGFIVPSWDSPRLTPVLVRGAWVLLTDDGTYLPDTLWRHRDL